MMRGLEPDDRSIIELSLQGYTAPEIGDRLGRAERTVRRVREHVKKRLQRMQAEETPVTAGSLGRTGREGYRPDAATAPDADRGRMAHVDRLRRSRPS